LRASTPGSGDTRRFGELGDEKLILIDWSHLSFVGDAKGRQR
jgi:hypothetical protein